TSLLALPLLGACATDPYTGRADGGTHILGGALIGAAAGALAGQSLGGNAITGAAAGMAVGGAVGAATMPHGTPRRVYYKDTRLVVGPRGLPTMPPLPGRCSPASAASSIRRARAGRRSGKISPGLGTAQCRRKPWSACGPTSGKC